MDDLKHGFGKEIRPDGTVFEGQYFNGVKHGKGALQKPDGSYYLGDFHSG